MKKKETSRNKKENNFITKQDKFNQRRELTSVDETLYVQLKF